jgi:hypothetical protein
MKNGFMFKGYSMRISPFSRTSHVEEGDLTGILARASVLVGPFAAS